MQEYGLNKKQAKDGNKNYLNMFLNREIQLRVPHRTSREDIWKNLLKQLERQNEKRDSQFKFNFPIRYQMVAAATVLLLLGTFFLHSLSETVSYATQHSQISEFCLPDQSVVTLNADSKIVYKRNFWNGSREVYLQGEAIFEVQKGKLFDVNTDNGNVQVLGTSFNVYTRGSELRVSCFTGKVLVKLPQNSDSVFLTKGMETFKNKSNYLEDPILFDSHKTAQWKNGEFYFRHEKLTNVFKEIERQFNVKVYHRNLSKRYYSGSFKNNNLNQALDLVCIPMDLNYSIKNDSVVKIRPKK